MGTNGIDETLAALFAAETKEQLENFSRILMVVEGDPGSIETEVHELFRIAHNIKGSSGMMGLNDVKETMHSVENLFDEIRKGNVGLPSEKIDVLLELGDELLAYVEAADWNQEWDKQHWAEAFGAKSNAVSPANNNSATSAPTAVAKNMPPFKRIISNKQRETLEDWLKSGKYIYRVELFFNKTAGMKSVSVMTFSNFLAGFGTVLGNMPTFEEPDFESCPTVSIIMQTDAEFAADMIQKIEKYPVMDVTAVELERWTEIPDDKKSAVVSEGNTDKAVSSTKAIANLNAQTIRVDSFKIDKLINYMGELLTIKAGFRELITEKDEEGKKVWDRYTTLVQQLDTITGDIQADLLDLRMVPMEQIFSRFPRVVRDIAKRSDKSVELKLFGTETEIDKQVAEKLIDPLTHLIRNSVDHGIESKEERESRGKSDSGVVTMGAYQEGESIVVSISDDGNGIDPQKIRKKAIEKGLISEETEISDDDVIKLIFKPGFSTAAKVSDISGRGVGLDVVETSLKELKGEIETHTSLGKGTTFRLKVPLTLAVIQVFLVKIADQIVALPAGNVTESCLIYPKELKMIGDNRAFMLRNEILPIVSIHHCFGTEENQGTDFLTLVVLKKGHSRIGIVVDQLIGKSEIMIKRINEALPEIPLVTGATILGNGEVGIILDANQIFEERAEVEAIDTGLLG